MRHRAKGRQLSRTSSHRRALLNNMATSLFEHGRVVTTEAKAKELRPFAEKLITLARRGDLHARRLVERKIKSRETLSRLFSEIGHGSRRGPAATPASSSWATATVTARMSPASSCSPSDRRLASRQQERGP